MKSILKGKLFALLGIISLFISLLIIGITPTNTGYEFSIYNSYPVYMWIGLISSIFFGILGIILSYQSNKNPIFGFIVVIMGLMVFFSIPEFRGYFLFGRSDVFSHIGYIKNILSTGYFGTDGYPIIHILGSSMYNITGLALSRVLILIPALFFIFYFISSHIMHKKIFKYDQEVYIGLCLIVIPLTLVNSLFAPYLLSILFIPFFIYCYVQSRSSEKNAEYSILLILLMFFITFLHPLTTLILITILVLFELSYLIFKSNKIPKFMNKRVSDASIEETKKLRPSTNLILILTIIFFTWEAYAYLFWKKLFNIVYFLFNEGGESQISNYAEISSYGNLNLTDIIVHALNSYGHFAIIGLLALFSIFYLYRKKKFDWITQTSTFVYISLLLLTAGSFIITYVFGWLRIYSVSIIFAIILISKAFGDIFINNLRYNKLKKVIFALCIILVAYFCFSSIYFSPIIKKPNEQISKAEFIGMETFFDHRNNSYQIREIGISQWRFFEGIYGRSDKLLGTPNISTKNIIHDNRTPIDHFGYNNSTLMGEYKSYHNNYLLINSVGKQFYQEIYPEYSDKWRFNPDDFNNLTNDPTVNNIYTNGDLSIYFIG